MFGVSWPFETVFQSFSRWGWSSGATVLGKLLVPGRLTNLIIVGQKPIALAIRPCGSCLDIFLSSIISIPLSGRRPDIDRTTASKGR